MKTPKISVMLDSARGQYIPRDFALTAKLKNFRGINPRDLADCKNPNNENYWDSWNNILNTARYIEDGRIFQLHHDGDLFLLCVEEMSKSEIRAWFGE